jgi:hypothetical protein
MINDDQTPIVALTCTFSGFQHCPPTRGSLS